MAFTLLQNINSINDLKNLNSKQLPELAEEIRSKIIEVVGKNGGHLASNLGVVELTIALHRVFDSPKDAIIFDVSHQCYAHKLLTGRYKEFDSLRVHSGLSGFTRRSESEHDFFNNGHSSTSISQGLGLLTAWQLDSKDGKVVAVIGDGALTGGLAFEALSHAGQLNKNLIVVLNDNQMSISKNTGALSRYLSSLSVAPWYQKIKNKFEGTNINSPERAKKFFYKLLYKIKRGLKGLFYSNNFFTDLGFEYVGPLDGHSLIALEKVFKKIKNINNPVVVHVRTKKGKGYLPAEDNPTLFHGIGPFHISDGKVEKLHTLTFTESFSRSLVELAKNNEKICGITAAMTQGTGLDLFSSLYPKRFFDVGIAEEHALTFAAGLSAGGRIPVVCVYSTFVQRAVDQVIHDLALPDFNAVIVLDRSGVVPGDGSTHQGMFDIALFRCIPNITILTPESDEGMKLMLEYACSGKGTVIIRYPKLVCPPSFEVFKNKIEIGRGVLLKCQDYLPALTDRTAEHKAQVLFVCTGGFFTEVLEAARSLVTEDVYCDIYSLRFIKPLDEKYFAEVCKNYESVVILEDGVKTGGIADYLASVYKSMCPENSKKVCAMAFPDRFLPHGTRSEICQDAAMSPRDIALTAIKVLRGQS